MEFAADVAEIDEVWERPVCGRGNLAPALAHLGWDQRQPKSRVHVGLGGRRPARARLDLVETPFIQ